MLSTLLNTNPNRWIVNVGNFLSSNSICELTEPEEQISPNEDPGLKDSKNVDNLLETHQITNREYIKPINKKSKDGTPNRKGKGLGKK